MSGSREGFHHRRRNWEPSAQQKRILDDVAQGFTNDEIARRSAISADGVKWHISEMLGETGLRSRYEVADWWRNRKPHGLLAFLAWPWMLRLGSGAGGVLVAVTVIAFITGLLPRDKTSDPEQILQSSGVDIGRQDVATQQPVVAAPSNEARGKPFFAVRQMDYVSIPTVRLSGGDLDHPVTIPAIEFNAACDNSTPNGLACSAGVSRANLPEPDASLHRYRFDFVYPEADYDVPNEQYWYGGANVLSQQYWYVPSEPAVVGPLPGYGWLQLGQPAADLMQRYIALTNADLVTEEPTFQEALTASLDYFDATASVMEPELGGSMVPLPEATARQFGSLLGQIEPVTVAVHGNLVGQRELDAVPIEIRLGSEILPFFYIPPGEITAEGLLLLSQASLTSWGYVSALSPAGYTKAAYLAHQALDALMTELGFAGGSLDDDIESSVHRPEPVHLRFIDRIEIWREGDEERTVLPELKRQPCLHGCDLDYPSALPDAKPLKVAIWPTGVPPFRDVVSPALYDYYLDDGMGSGRGVLVETACPAVGGGHCVLYEPFSFYPPPPIDVMLREAALRHGDLQRAFVKASDAPL